MVKLVLFILLTLAYVTEYASFSVLVVIGIYFITFKGKRGNLPAQTVLISFGIFHLIPFVFYFMSQEGNRYIMLDINEELNSANIVWANLIFGLFLLGFSYTGFRSFIYSTSTRGWVKNYLFGIIILALVGKLIQISQVLSYGYISSHLGEGLNKRNPIFGIIEFLMPMTIGYLYFYRKKVAIPLILIYASLLLLTGMRLPFFGLIFTLFILVRWQNQWIFRWYHVVLGSLIIPAFLLFSQVSRLDINLSDVNEQYGTSNFYVAAVESQLEVLNTTNDLLFASEQIKLNHFNPFYFIGNFIDLLGRKFSGKKVANMEERAEIGNYGYLVYQRFNGENYSQGKTAGGSALAEVYYYFWLIGPLLFGLLISYFVQTLKLLLDSNLLLGNLLVFAIIPYLLRFFRDGYMVIIFFVFLYILLSSFIVKIKVIKNVKRVN